MSTTVREEYEVGDLDPSAVLELARDNERELREREFRKLQLAAHWADLHPATADTGVETFGGAALLADLPDLRRRAGLCPSCGTPHRGPDGVCPACQSGTASPRPRPGRCRSRPAR